MNNPEQKYYQAIYAAKDKYGGSPINLNTQSLLSLQTQFLLVIKKKQVKSILDVGCGNNYFVDYLRKTTKIHAWGIDFASPKADQIADILKLPFKNKEWDWITIWSALEHLRPEQIDIGLKEMSRVSNNFAIETVREPGTRNLKRTLWGRELWVEHINKFGKIIKTIPHKVKKKELYIGRWNE
tara:strand:+ start:4036 stop:4584 length:549 start_codon:yes stop_codon:yes gene_type:complete